MNMNMSEAVQILGVLNAWAEAAVEGGSCLLEFPLHGTKILAYTKAPCGEAMPEKTLNRCIQRDNLRIDKKYATTHELMESLRII